MLQLAGVYIIMAYNLPNREFYKQFKDASFSQVEVNILSVMRYVGLELLSFVLFHYAVYRRIRFSTLHQIAFVFESQWRLVQTKIIVWVLFTVQLPLYHFGESLPLASMCERCAIRLTHRVWRFLQDRIRLSSLSGSEPRDEGEWRRARGLADSDRLS